MFCLLVVLVQLSLLAKWFARKTPLRKPNRDEAIISIKPRQKRAYDCVGLLYSFAVLLHDICLLHWSYVIHFLLQWHDIAYLCWRCHKTPTNWLLIFRLLRFHCRYKSLLILSVLSPCVRLLTAELYSRYEFLEKVLSRDFVFQPLHTRPVSNCLVDRCTVFIAFRVLVCWWWWFDWSFARLIAPVVQLSPLTTSVILCFNKHRLTQVHLENGR